MSSKPTSSRLRWRDALIPANEHGEAWELFHENSKTSRYDAPLDNAEVRRRMDDLWPSLTYEGYPCVELPEPPPLDQSLSQTLLARHTTRVMKPCRFTLVQISALLHYSYGQTRDLTEQGYARKFRVVPSGGALYPLELYFHSSQVDGLAAGWYHYSSAEHALHTLRGGDDSRRLSEALVQRELALDAGLIVFITGLFSRSTFKYGERGYRFALLEAGHVAQNLCLVAEALGLGVTPIGGYLDREVDALLQLDGVVQSALYGLAFGRDAQPEAPPGSAGSSAAIEG